ncbi:MAG: nitroreductase family protein, partial [Clostridia bacterium]|nr:nitroreductase family protein [Clostridia bacterium]
MDFLKLTAIRQSERNYDLRTVERDLLDKCTEAARMAPSACNSQPWKFILVDEPALVKKIASCTYSGTVRFNKFTDKAAAFAVIVMEPGNIVSRAGAFLSKTDYAFIDMGIAAEHFCLLAAESGIGTCILGWCRRKEIKKLLGIPSDKKVGL